MGNCCSTTVTRDPHPSHNLIQWEQTMPQTISESFFQNHENQFNDRYTSFITIDDIIDVGCNTDSIDNKTNKDDIESSTGQSLVLDALVLTHSLFTDSSYVIYTYPIFA